MPTPHPFTPRPAVGTAATGPATGPATGTAATGPLPGSTRSLWAWAFYDWANSGFAALVQTFVFAAFFARAVAENETVGTALWGNMMGAAGLVIGLGGPLLGAVADRSGRRKPWLAAFSGLCIAATACLWFVRPDPSFVWLGLVLAGLGTIGSEYAMIFYNAMLPGLADERTLGRWSGWGWGLGYAGGVVLLVIALYGFVEPNAWFDLPRAESEHVRAVMPLTALWYLVFCLPLFLLCPDAPSRGIALGRAVAEGAAQLRNSLRRVRDYRDIAVFLLARMLYNDGMTTMFAFGGIYAAGTFGMGPSQIIVFGIGLNVTAGLGAAAFAWLDDRAGPRRTIIVSLIGLIVPGVLILLVESQTLFWIFGLSLGIFVGPVQASSRSYLARVAPEAVRGEMFGLFALSGKLTSFLGPLLVGWLTLASGSQRVGMASVIVLFVLGLAGMMLVPPARAHKGE
ncbi:MAG: MFS transporter [Pseudodesulfovibrio sp.]|uniref:Major facilitator superfamily protein n=1 Tax=Pseudodesulfovibrio aespoeensis (strain ATCC 700646 / DSM 10631 / Aspo-2) TaxID=643562 RepID=E6VQM5_PSEA9|nr:MULTISPECIES: MFS transporter [Pseudodesulfovibrio]MBU4244541.1 MFS transporter [Pseudomonadota bacterium]ADU61752.1 major facilitator superfamily protein [Pseudodesulfovibrio aespoeensis Aspo-2]MBU4378095.1 MFS transporter [Pseudomonadota bacterium]MBU4475812.1 MFS transporter [Pseudomonadota bacterium]MBU4515795.1 MFS transporter [Pseudomonadota bacterium]